MRKKFLLESDIKDPLVNPWGCEITVEESETQDDLNQFKKQFTLLKVQSFWNKDENKNLSEDDKVLLRCEKPADRKKLAGIYPFVKIDGKTISLKDEKWLSKAEEGFHMPLRTKARFHCYTCRMNGRPNGKCQYVCLPCKAILCMYCWFEHFPAHHAKK